MKISVIIPTYNEENYIGKLVRYLFKHAHTNCSFEIIVVDGQSPDKTVELARKAGAKVYISEQKSRARQMNIGAACAHGDIYYFLHADSYPPKDFTKEIINAVNQGCQSGCFRLKFDRYFWFLELQSWFTRFNWKRIRFGDQSLFIDKKLFDKISGFNENLILLEDQEIINRISKNTHFKVLPKAVVTSTRKYLVNGIYRLQFIYFYIYLLYLLGFSQDKLTNIYKKLVIQ
ncbi:MAG: TIGR04283 family arsenosugar biosynthesis glycosyltransferase [Bacteroidetes bacterium]|nr:TIGR04283 family arsenosugar biosynthesis glycosyltransferase [Bacteroidota bacterium]